MNWPSHGANPIKLYKEMSAEQPASVVDFSVNTNPLGSPDGLRSHLEKSLEKIHNYPDPDSERLHQRLAKQHEVTQNQVLVGNGASEMIYLLAQLWQGQRVGIVQPTFSEYQKACDAYGCKIYPIMLEEEHQFDLNPSNYRPFLDLIDVLFLCHPNNPTGAVYKPHILQDLIRQCKEKEVVVVIDEAFYDFVADVPFYSPHVIENSNVILLRSLTKMFAIPGLRLGYAVGEPSLIKRMKMYQPTWSVNSFAEEAGLYCLGKSRFQQQTAEAISVEKRSLFTKLKELGYRPITTQTNYFLMKDPFHEDTKAMIGFLLRRGVIVRHTYNFLSLEGRFVRVAIKRREENERLLSALQRWRFLCSP
ncbi:threonine-phosphate decarboxylase CobD [Halobacillus mangrovi]|uniref:threonine-phosphate decarboxylase n=1 Tax=Halobacillus mangrovi TaxID=402384 RepID=A0A1W5ZZ70_9BACI|nr:threonine-phosphate decarboxylase CobD [Halobacillus mangrovi]ARI78560.1 threonine-phosphate decarboxylase [Halobacillus mangrovi]